MSLLVSTYIAKSYISNLGFNTKSSEQLNYKKLMRTIRKHTLRPDLVSFSIALTIDDPDLIILYMLTEMKDLFLKQKVDMFVEGLCNFSIRTLEIIIPKFNIAYNYGTTLPLYLRAMTCNTRIFGFIATLYSPPYEFLLKAYKFAASNDLLEVLKKVRGISCSDLRRLSYDGYYMSTLTPEIQYHIKNASRIECAKKYKNVLGDLLLKNLSISTKKKRKYSSSSKR